MAWVVSVIADREGAQTDRATFTAVFTDADSTVFSFSRTSLVTLAAANAFVTDAVAARNAWQAAKTRETTTGTQLANRFIAAGESAAVAPPT